MADRETHVANYFETALTAELGPTDLVAEVMSTGGLQSPAILVIEPDDPNQREVILFDDAFTDTEFRATSVASRYLGGSAQPGGLTHPVGSVVRSAPLAQHIQDLNDRIDADRLRITSLEEATVGTAKLADGAVTTPKLADGAVTAAKIADWAVPRGVLGYAFRTSTITGLSDGLVDLPGLSVQVTVPAGRVLRVVGYVHAWTGPTQGDQANLLVREGSNVLHIKRVIAATTNRAEGGSVQALIRPSAGTHTYKLTFQRLAGTSDWDIEASSASPTYILVEDLGADPNA